MDKVLPAAAAEGGIRLGAPIGKTNSPNPTGGAQDAAPAGRCGLGDDEQSPNPHLIVPNSPNPPYDRSDDLPEQEQKTIRFTRYLLATRRLRRKAAAHTLMESVVRGAEGQNPFSASRGDRVPNSTKTEKPLFASVTPGPRSPYRG